MIVNIDATTDVTPRAVKSSSPIYKLDLTLKDSVLCDGGRLQNSTLLKEVKNLMILPNNHHVVLMIIGYYHALSAHSSLEYVLALFRERFWIVDA